jgi:hypothetical protein
MKLQSTFIIVLLFLANGVYADTVNLRCEHLYIDLDTKSNSVIFSYAGDRKKTQHLTQYSLADWSPNNYQT